MYRRLLRRPRERDSQLYKQSPRARATSRGSTEAKAGISAIRGGARNRNGSAHNQQRERERERETCTQRGCPKDLKIQSEVSAQDSNIISRIKKGIGLNLKMALYNNYVYWAHTDITYLLCWSPIPIYVCSMYRDIRFAACGRVCAKWRKGTVAQATTVTHSSTKPYLIQDHFLPAAKPTGLVETNSSFFLSLFLQAQKKASKQPKPVMFHLWQSKHKWEKSCSPLSLYKACACALTQALTSLTALISLICKLTAEQETPHFIRVVRAQALYKERRLLSFMFWLPQMKHHRFGLFWSFFASS